MSHPGDILSGVPPLDQVLQHIRLGDNVVWQVDQLEDYTAFAQPFVDQALADGRSILYFRFGSHPPVVAERPGLRVEAVDPTRGFDAFSQVVHRIIEAEGRGAFYVFDNLSSLAVKWATDEMLANFFQVTCPYLFELDTVAFFALTRGKHAHSAVARIRDTTQLLIDVYRVEGRLYIHPLKVWDRYTPEMFHPHLVEGNEWEPVLQSGEAATVLAQARRVPLGASARSIAPWDAVHRKLLQYLETAPDPELAPEIDALKRELIHMMLGSGEEMARLALEHMEVHDLFEIRERLIGSGRVGGKTAGMLMARAILRRSPDDPALGQMLEPHDSFYIGSDVFFTFLVYNDLFRLRLRLSNTSHISYEEFAEVEQRFLAGRFPGEIVQQFQALLEHYGQAPIIVRSSSLLEDSFGNAFAGKYRSEFCANQGSPDDRLHAFMHAVKLVYASALNPDALSYRRRRGLGERDEQMAILVQRVSGSRHGRFFFPSLAGVAFSRNLYAWNDRIDPEQGVVRLVFGLGTRAVDRVGGDYPRMISISHPELRPQVGAEVAKYSQHHVDVLDLEQNSFSCLPLDELLEDASPPDLHLLLSAFEDGHLSDPIGAMLETRGRRLVLTFNNLVRRTPFVKLIGRMVARLEEAYGHPVDTEFTATVKASGAARVNLLQCRPLWLPGSAGAVCMPEDLPPERVLFRADRTISGGVIRNIRYILYIDPRWYAGITDLSRKKTLGRIVGRINGHPDMADEKLLMMGPGRWGSGNLDLGVNVGYADIDKAAVLVEIAREEHGHVPEVSYGTHFFQDLVEDQVVYLPLYPDRPEAAFNHVFFEGASNVLARFMDGVEGWDSLVQVIDVADGHPERRVCVIADPAAQQAVCFLEDHA